MPVRQAGLVERFNANGPGEINLRVAFEPRAALVGACYQATAGLSRA